MSFEVFLFLKGGTTGLKFLYEVWNKSTDCGCQITSLGRKKNRERKRKRGPFTRRCYIRPQRHTRHSHVNGWVPVGFVFYFIFGFIFIFSSLSTGMDGWTAITESLGSHFVFVVVVVSSVFLFFCSWTRRLPGLSWAAVLDRERERESGDSNKDWCWDGGHCCFFLLSHGPSVASGQLYYKTPALYLYTQGPNCIPFIGQHLAPFVSNRFWRDNHLLTRYSSRNDNSAQNE